MALRITLGRRSSGRSAHANFDKRHALTIHISDTDKNKKFVNASLAVILLIEFDSWPSGSFVTHESDPTINTNTIVTAMVGKIKKSQFVLEKAFVGRALNLLDLFTKLSPPFNDPHFKLAADLKKMPDDPKQNVITVVLQEQEFIIPMNDNDISREGGYFEMGAFIVANSAPANDTEVALTPVAVPIRIIPKDRPVITFITGKEGTHSNHVIFFKKAHEFFAPVSDHLVVFSKISNGLETMDLKNMFEYLRKHKQPQPWGEINIVAHGSPHLWALPPTAFDDPELGISLNNIQDCVTKVQALDSSIADDKTLVVLRGCEVGKDQKLLDGLRFFFGGQATMLAPKFAQTYGSEKRTGRVFEALSRVFDRQIPGASGEDVNLSKTKILEANPTLARADLDKMENLVETFRHEVKLTRAEDFHDLLDGKPSSDVPGLLLPIVKRKGITDVNGSNVDDWGDWESEITADDNNKPVSVLLRGFRTRIMFFQVLTDDKQRLVVPSIEDPALYARSPAW